MRKMYASGTSVVQIAKYFNVTRPTVYKYINIRKRWEEDNFDYKDEEGQMWTV